MCQIIWDSQFVHNAHILAVRMQHYSKTVSFQEIQCSGEVNIYLHNLTLLSDCLIFPGDFPLLFHSTPKLSFKTFCTKKDMTSPEDSGLSDPDDATCALHYSCELPEYVPASCLTASVVSMFASFTNPPRTPAKVTSTSSSLLIPSYQDSFAPHSTPILSPFIVIIAIILLSTSTALCGFSLGRH